MNARLLSGIAGGCVAGFAVGWLSHPDASAAKNEVSEKRIAKLEADLKSKTAEVDRLTVTARKEAADKTAREPEMKEYTADSPEMKKMQERMKRNYAQKEKLKLDEKVAALRTRLGLNDAQAAAVRDLLEKSPGGLQSFMARAMSGEEMDEKSAMAYLLKPGRKDAELTAKITELLTPEQQQAYTAFRQEQRSNEVEVKANKELARLQTSLTLSPEQKDKAFAALSKLADEEYDNPVNPMAAMIQQQMKLMPKHSPPGADEHLDEINAAAEFAAERRKLRVEAMREVLSEEQLALYESQQKQGSMAEMMDGAFDDLPGGFFMGGMEDDEEQPAGGAAKGTETKPRPAR